ncbi:TrbL/VirB6 plasmid conjugal transfer protein [Stenotrophomonas maltophilia R551-3]|uniref:TrbL/VirB6 plasmid conjugal transfer protein n=2 Tax=Stenotrophomonas maltophilia TaxID=40324 RepID=B4SNB7_STRM5|nr:TrbL/VirB6 plasmid conjugal transfer protein [Stenotrophomonas maltophilia R551-3]
MDLGLMDGMSGQGPLHMLQNLHASSSIGDFVFFRLILDYLHKEIAEYGVKLLGRMMAWVGGIALTLMTLWVLIQGFRIATGRSRDSMMVLVTNMAKAALIVSVATTMGMFGREMHGFLINDVKNEITYVVTGKKDSPEDLIDENLGYMQLALSSVDALDVMSDVTLDNAKTRAMWFIGMGTGGPAVTAGSMLLLYEVALALFIGLGPLFILCLLFDQTKQLFQKWLLYGIGTMFSMAVLAAMTGIAMKMVSKVAFAFWGSTLTGTLMGQNFSEGMSSMALQQGGMGLILTTLILTAPPMAAMFFQGTLGSFMAYSQIGGSAVPASPGPNGQPPGSTGGQSYRPQAPAGEGGGSPMGMQVANPRLHVGPDSATHSPGLRGNAGTGVA